MKWGLINLNNTVLSFTRQAPLWEPPANVIEKSFSYFKGTITRLTAASCQCCARPFARLYSIYIYISGRSGWWPDTGMLACRTCWRFYYYKPCCAYYITPQKLLAHASGHAGKIETEGGVWSNCHL